MANMLFFLLRIKSSPFENKGLNRILALAINGQCFEFIDYRSGRNCFH